MKKTLLALVMVIALVVMVAGCNLLPFGGGSSDLGQTFSVLGDAYEISVPDSWVEDPDESGINGTDMFRCGVAYEVYFDVFEYEGYTLDEEIDYIGSYLGDDIIAEGSATINGYEAYQFEYDMTDTDVNGNLAGYRGVYTIVAIADDHMVEMDGYYVLNDDEPTDDEISILFSVADSFAVK
jgi:hypothetical protein